ncbi:MAG: hypothetical protein WBX15_13090 [Thermoanaerobaculia bacterium]
MANPFADAGDVRVFAILMLLIAVNSLIWALAVYGLLRGAAAGWRRLRPGMLHAGS